MRGATSATTSGTRVTVRRMLIASQIIVTLIGVLHIYILIMEMFLWRSERAYKAFGTTPEVAAITAPLAANQGLYNGFLAAGLLWGVIHPNRAFAWQIQTFFLLCVAVAGVYGAATAKRSILFVQTVPSAIGLALVLLANQAGG
jgi:putative membrane protein